MNADQRRYDLDWLRVFATYLLFPYHVAKTFDVTPIYHIKNTELVPTLDYLTRFIHQWHMPLFFALAGWSVHASLARRGVGDFLRERVQRVVVPFVVGVVVLCPIVKYLELSSGLSITARGAAPLGARFTESFLEFLPSFYTRMDRFTWSHLWFLAYLFTFTLLYLPLFKRLLETRAARTQPSVARLYAPLVPLILIQTTLRFRWPGLQNLYDDWANFTYYSLFFILGFVLAWQPAWNDVIAREWRRAGVIGLGAAVAMSLGWMALGGIHWPIDPAPHAIATALPLQLLSGVTGYCLVVAILGLARERLTHPGAGLAYLVESSLPVYVLHQLGVVVCAYFIVRLPLGVATKIVVLLVTSVACTMVAYHFVVRRIPLVRAALGMGASAPPLRAQPARAQIAV